MSILSSGKRNARRVSRPRVHTPVRLKAGVFSLSLRALTFCHLLSQALPRGQADSTAPADVLLPERFRS